jgi:hypothetical protein
VSLVYPKGYTPKVTLGMEWGTPGGVDHFVRIPGTYVHPWTGMVTPLMPLGPFPCAHSACDAAWEHFRGEK